MQERLWQVDVGWRPKAYHEPYLYPDSLEEFATALKEYPRSSADEVVRVIKTGY